MKALLLAVPLLALTATAQAADIKAQIEAANQQWLAAYGRGDAGSITALYTDQATVLPPGQEPVKGHDAIQKFWADAIQSGLKVTSLHAVSVEQYGDVAREIGTVSGEAPDASKQMVKIEGKYVVVWKRMKGSWKLDTDIWNLNR